MTQASFLMSEAKAMTFAVKHENAIALQPNMNENVLIAKNKQTKGS